MFVYLIDKVGNVTLSRHRLDLGYRMVDYLEFRPQDCLDVEDYYNFISDYLPQPLNKPKYWNEYEWRFQCQRNTSTEDYSLDHGDHGDHGDDTDDIDDGADSTFAKDYYKEDTNDDDDTEVYGW
jgi:hypothetical protein